MTNAEAPADTAAPRSGARRQAAGAPRAPRGFPRAERPGHVPAPEHHHLPGWVRRAHARARAPLADLLGLLDGERRDALAARVDELTAGINAGRFSLAWQYPQLIDEGRGLYEEQRRARAESDREARVLDSARRRAADRLRDGGGSVPAEVVSRLQRALRSAGDAAAIAAVDAEIDRTLAAAQDAGSRRRDREIERTRARIRRSLPRTAPTAEPGETWQDVLRRFAEQQADDGGE